MLGLSVGHLVILGIVVLLFGSRRLPELGSGMGKTLRAFKEAIEGRETGKMSEKQSLTDEGESRTRES